MEKVAFIVERLNMPPFSKGISTLTEFDSKSSLELLELMCEIVTAIDPDQESIFKENTEARVHRIMDFLNVMKFSIPPDQVEEFQNMLLGGDKDVLHTVMFWSLQRYEHLKKRAYLAKFLLPIDIPAEFMGEDLIEDLSIRLKELQTEFKEVHKNVEQVRSTGAKPSELKQEIVQLEQEKTQLQNKIQKMKKDMTVDEDYFKEMLKATSALRKEQENEVLIHERLRENRKSAQEADLRFSDASKRLHDMKSTGLRTQSAEQILSRLHQDVKELNDRRENLERVLHERESHLEKIQNWDNNDRVTTDEDVRQKREQLMDYEDHVKSLQEKLDVALERNEKLVIFRQASTVQLKKFREKEDEVEKLTEELRRIQKQTEDKENEMKASSKGNNGKIGKNDLKKYSAIVREKIEKYKKMREELGSLRSELVVLHRTEEILKSRHENLDQFLSELEREKGIEGYRENQRAIIEMTEKTAEVDQLKGATLEDISMMVEQIGREFKNKSHQLQPMIKELKETRQEYMDVESQYQEKKIKYDKVAVGLDMEKQSLEKDCDYFQEECLREESRYHYLQNLISIARIRQERYDEEKKWQNGQGRMMRDFGSLKELYAHKLTQQDSLTKQLRKQQKELKENANALTNQKSNFLNLQALLNMKLRTGGNVNSLLGDNNLKFSDSITPAYAEYGAK